MLWTGAENHIKKTNFAPNIPQHAMGHSYPREQWKTWKPVFQSVLKTMLKISRLGSLPLDLTLQCLTGWRQQFIPGRNAMGLKTFISLGGEGFLPLIWLCTCMRKCNDEQFILQENWSLQCGHKIQKKHTTDIILVELATGTWNYSAIMESVFLLCPGHPQ